MNCCQHSLAIVFVQTGSRRCFIAPFHALRDTGKGLRMAAQRASISRIKAQAFGFEIATELHRLLLAEVA